EGVIARHIAQHGKPSLVVIDHIGLLDAPGIKERTVAVGKITRALKNLARRLEIPVIALCQVNRQVDQREDHRPMLSDLRESGTIEHDANIIVFTYRPSYYLKPAERQAIEEAGADAEIIIAKNRSGQVQSLDCFTWIGPRTLFMVK